MSLYRYLGTIALALLLLLVPSGLRVQAQATAGITITPSTAITTTEAGTSVSLTVVLNTKPTDNVVIRFVSSDPAEATISPTALSFSPTTWNNPQPLTVKGVDDQVVDGNIGYTIITTPVESSDRNYAGLNIADIAGTNTDNDTAGFLVSPTSGLTTTEAGASAYFTIALSSKPTRNVNVGISSSNINEGVVSTALLVFNSGNWDAPQRVTVTGVDDNVVDGAVNYSIITAAAISGDSRYNNVNPVDVTVSNGDNDASGIVVTPMSGLKTSEAGGLAGFTVALGSQPSANVVIGLSSSNTAEGTVSPTSLTFTSTNWKTAQRVTVKGVDDKLVDGSKAYTIVTAAAISTDTRFNGINPSDVSVTNTDNDVGGINVTPVSRLVTTEKAGTSSFSIKLTSQPTANVTIGLASSDTTEGTVSPASVTFTTSNWSTAQRVTVTGVNDTFVDGNKNYTIATAAATSTDPAFSSLNATDVTVQNRDDETINFSTSSINVNESAGTATFTVQLSGSPESGTGNVVTVAYATNDRTAFASADYSAIGGTLSFAAGEQSKTITVPIANDTVGEETESFQVKLTTPTNGILGNTAITTANIQANDKFSLGTTTMTIAENARTATITVKLNGPNTTQTTKVAYTTSNDTATAGSDYTSTAGTLTFAPGDTVKTFTVPISDDNLGEANEQFKVTLSAPENASLGTPSAASVVIATNDPILFTASSILTHENAGNALVSLKLSGGAVSSAVSVNYVTSDGTALAGSDYTTASGTVTFAAGEHTKTFVVPIREDTLAEENETIRLTLSNPVNGVLGSSPIGTLTIQANDTVGFQADNFTVIEYEKVAPVTVKLNAPSADTVTVKYATSDGTATTSGDYTSASGTLTFAPGETSKTFTVPIGDDTDSEGNETIKLSLNTASKAVLGRSTATITIVSNE